MFRDKPSAYERVMSAVSDIGERIAELESQIVDQVNAAPARADRLRRGVEHELARLPALSPPNVSRYLPAFLGNWSLPSSADVRTSLQRAQRSLRDGAEEARDHLPSWSSFQMPSLRSSRVSTFKDGMSFQRGLDYVRARPGVSTLVIVGGTVALVGTVFYVSKKISEHAEEPDFETVRRDGAIEIRDYDAMVIAETVKSGYHEKARSRGFETLYDFIRANNRSGKKIAMTVPVLQQLSEDEGRTRGWAVRFVMPKKYTKASLPTPNSDDVRIVEVPARRVASIQFNGVFNASLASKKLMSLYNYLSDENLKQKGDPIYAFYNPPWTPGFMRRNEILIEIER